MKIQDVINEIRNSQVGVHSITTDAATIFRNSKGTLTYVGTLFTKKHVNSQPGDIIIPTGNKSTNITAVERTLTALIGKGEVAVRLMNWKIMIGEIEA